MHPRPTDLPTELDDAMVVLQPGSGGQQVSDHEFGQFQRLIHEESGIHLTQVKKSLLTGRLQARLRELGISSFAGYLAVVRRDRHELQEMIDRICTTETRFFREPAHYEFLARELLPVYIQRANRGARPRSLRIWSAACATGEEPYSLAMVAERYMPKTLGWNVEIHATDLCKRALRQALSGLWPIEQASQIPEYYRKRFMLRGVRERARTMAAGTQIRQLIRFRHMNLMSGLYPVRGPFDIIFCRNVLIYFKRTTRQQVIGRLFDHLAVDGYLFLGHAESLHHDPVAATQVFPTVYTRAPSATEAR